MANFQSFSINFKCLLMCESVKFYACRIINNCSSVHKINFYQQSLLHKHTNKYNNIQLSNKNNDNYQIFQYSIIDHMDWIIWTLSLIRCSFNITYIIQNNILHYVILFSKYIHRIEINLTYFCDKYEKLSAFQENSPFCI